MIISCNSSKTFAQTSTKQNTGSKKQPLQVLLVGTSHWNNYQSEGLDVAQTNEVDILSDKYQNELSEIVQKIERFKPDKIFVERTLDYQPKLDSLYKLYQTTAWGEDKRNEIYQLGFRLAKKLGHKKVYGIDYLGTQFPYDSLMTAMESAKQTKLMSSFQNGLKEYETNYNKLTSQQSPLKDILFFLNDKKQRNIDLSFYLSGTNQGGSLDNSVGSFLASEWIKRNIYSYGLLQKYTEADDRRIMVVMGTSHIAVLKSLMTYHPTWETVELKEIME